MKKLICFDMDGTIADLYGVKGWLEYVENENPIPYLIAKPLCDMNKLREVLLKLIEQDYEIRVISWLSKNSSEEFKKATKLAKLAWLEKHNFPYRVAHLVAYGTTKANCIRGITQKGSSILIDDNESIRDGWSMGTTIDPTKENIIERLEELLK